MSRHLTLDDFWKLSAVTEAQLSPDGSTVAYAVTSNHESTNTSRAAIWLVALEGGESRQFTSGESVDSSPRWSPDGSQLAFVSRRHENTPQVFVISVRGGEPKRVTSLKGGAHTPVWSPDGKRLCVTSDVETGGQKVDRETEWFEAHTEADGTVARMRSNRTIAFRFDGRGYIEKRPHLFLIDLDDLDAEPRQLTDGDQDDLAPVWSPNGERIAFVSNRREDAEHTRSTDLWTVDVESVHLTCLTDGTLTSQLPAWSPDGAEIAFYARPADPKNGWEDTHLWAISGTGGEARDVSSRLDRSNGLVLSDYVMPVAAPPAWSPDGRNVFFHAVDRGDNALFAVDRDGGDVRRVSPAGAVLGGIQCTPDGKSLLCVACTPTVPFECFMLPADGGELRQVTDSNRSLLDEIEILPTETINFKGAGDWDIEGWLVEPSGDAPRPYPLVLLVHGGPQAAWGNAFYFWQQVLAGTGYATLTINPRGSLGYGEHFAWAADWGQDDFADLMAGVDHVVARGEVDPQRMAVTGASYGGFMTNWILGHTDRFAAGVAVNSISNFVSFYGVSDIGATWFERSFNEHFGGRFWEDRARWMKYIERSPITYAENIKAPLLLISGENDYRCPIEQAEQLVTVLRMLHRTVELVRLPGASHGVMASPHQRWVRWMLTRDWFDRYLTGIKTTADREEEGITVPEPARV